MKKKVLILAHDQFGYSVTKFKHCQYASDFFDITYIGWDYGLPRLTLPYVEVKYVSRNSNLLMRNLKLLYTFHKEIQKGYDVVFLNYVRGSALVRLFNFRSVFIIYVDTLGVMPNKVKRWIYNFTLRIELSFFDNIAIISKGIAKKIWLTDYFILPLGGNCFSSKPKSFQQLSLLYVGTLSNRNILDCVKGFHLFIKKDNYIESTKPSFTIVGDSPFGELEEIKNYVVRNNLKKYIHTPGFVSSDKLNPFYDRANIGVSYVPITSYYQYQPPTKTFEYLISGLPVIATATEANKEILSPKVSELIKDDPASFYNAIKKMQERKKEFNNEWIRKEYSKHTWERVVNDNFVPLIDQLSKQ